MNNSFIFQVGDLYYSILTTTTVAVIQHNSYRTLPRITIPSRISYQGKEYNVVHIGDEAFSLCHCSEITIPDSITTIGREAFEASSGFLSLTIPDSVVSIDDEAFYDCCIQKVKLSKRLTTISDSLFYNCASLQKVFIPEGVTIIEGGAFDGCNVLHTIGLPASLQEIGTQAFVCCPRMRTILCYANDPPKNDSSAFWRPQKGTFLFVPPDSVAKYKKDSVWGWWKFNICPLTKDIEMRVK